MTRTTPHALDVSDRRRPRRSVASAVGSTLLNVAALGGVICIVLVILAYCCNITLIMFKTGSMSPTIPTGSLALVREIPAGDIAVGDVVTVDRAGKLPVTHRVTSVGAGPGTDRSQRTVTLRGDANAAEDPAPYVVSTVRIVLASVPGLAYVVIWFSNPWVLAGLTLGCSVLVMWAFWPRSGRSRSGPPGSGPPDSGPTGGTGRDRSTRAVAARPRRRPEGRHVRVVFALPVALCLGAGLAVGDTTARGAHAEPRVDVIAGDALVLTSIGDPGRMSSLRPGASAPWVVGVATKPSATPGTIEVSLVGSGSAELGLRMTVSDCTEPWIDDECPGTSTELTGDAPVPVDGVERDVLSVESEHPRWLRFDVSMSNEATATEGSVSLTVTAVGVGDTMSTSPGPISTLPPTGLPLQFAVWAAVGAIMLGLIAARLAAIRQRLRRGTR